MSCYTLIIHQKDISVTLDSPHSHQPPAELLYLCLNSFDYVRFGVASVVYCFFVLSRRVTSLQDICKNVSLNLWRNTNTCIQWEMWAHAFLPHDRVSVVCACSFGSLCPHIFAPHPYLIIHNKHFMPLNRGNTLYPDTRLSNHLDIFCSALPVVKKNKIFGSGPQTTLRPIIFYVLTETALKCPLRPMLKPR